MIKSINALAAEEKITKNDADIVMPVLEELAFSNCLSLCNLGALSNAICLRKLCLSGCPWIKSIEPLSTLERLEYLNLVSCGLALTLSSKSSLRTIFTLAKYSLNELHLSNSVNVSSIAILGFIECHNAKKRCDGKIKLCLFDR